MTNPVPFDKAMAQNQQDLAKEVVVRDLWQHVVKAMFQLLEAHHVLGFEQFHLKANPTVPEMKMALLLVDAGLDSLANSAGLTHQAATDLQNSKQTIFLMRRVFASIEQHNEDEYKDCISKLKNQKL